MQLGLEDEAWQADSMEGIFQMTADDFHLYSSTTNHYFLWFFQASYIRYMKQYLLWQRQIT